VKAVLAQICCYSSYYPRIQATGLPCHLAKSRAIQIFLFCDINSFILKYVHDSTASSNCRIFRKGGNLPKLHSKTHS
jgi:hypothetical protein